MTLIDDDLRLRVQRMLGGSVRSSDLTTLFLSQRAKPWACQSVVEIGDFIAHRDERERGSSYRQTRSAVLSAYAYAAQESGSPEQYKIVAEATQASLDNQEEDLIQEHMGFGLLAANSMLGRCRTKKFGLSKPLNPKEKRLASLLMEPAPKHIFSAGTLSRGLSDTLQQSGLLMPEEAEAFENCSDQILLFAITQMHGSCISVRDTTKSNLLGSGGSGTIRIWAEIKILNKYLAPVIINYCIFDTSLEARRFCHDELMAERSWTKTVEVKEDGLLGYAF